MGYNNYTADEIGAVAVALADKGLVLGANVARYADGDFLPGHGGKAYLRVPGAVTARSRALRDTTTAVVFDRLSEDRISVDLNNHLLSGVVIGDAELSLDIRDFAKQVLAPQADAVVDGIETAVAKVIDEVNAEDMSADYLPGDPQKIFTRARRALRDRGVDLATERLLAFVGGNVVDALLDSGALDFSKTGDADALRSGTVGRVRGFETVESGRIGADEIVLTTASGIYLATSTPAIPDGVNFGSIVRDKGLALRYLRDYDPSTLQERSIVSTFVGAGIAPLYDVQRDATTGKTTVTSVAGGAVVKFATA